MSQPTDCEGVICKEQETLEPNGAVLWGGYAGKMMPWSPGQWWPITKEIGK